MVWASGDRGAPVPDLGHCASIGGLTAPLACCCANSRGWQRGRSLMEPSDVHVAQRRDSSRLNCRLGLSKCQFAAYERSRWAAIAEGSRCRLLGCR